jgi:tetratricopeptide (TPR) repeat protein
MLMIMKIARIISAAFLLLAALSVSAQDWRRLEQEKRYDEALAALEKLAAEDTARQAEFMRSAMEIALEQLKNKVLARKYVEMTQDQAWRAFLRFYFYNATGQPDEALKGLQEKGIADFPVTVHTEAYTTLGNIYKARKETNKALEAYLKAVDSKGGAIIHFSWACKYAADIYLEKGETDKAVEMYKKCLQNKVFLAARHMCLFDYAALLLKENRTAAALDLLESEKPLFEGTCKSYWKAVFFLHYAKILNLNGMRVKAMDMYGVAEKSGATGSMLKQIEDQRSAITRQMISEL